MTGTLSSRGQLDRRDPDEIVPTFASADKVVLSEALGRLPRQAQLILSCLYVEALNLVEVAFVMGLKVHDVRLCHAAALQFLREVLNRD
jgi:DNA-directed RNA polymerase specialized sigma subunit